MRIEQKNYIHIRISGTKESELVIRQESETIVIERESIPELLKYIKENYNL